MGTRLAATLLLMPIPPLLAFALVPRLGNALAAGDPVAIAGLAALIVAGFSLISPADEPTARADEAGASNRRRA